MLRAADIDAGDQRLDHWQSCRCRPRLLFALARLAGTRHVCLVRQWFWPEVAVVVDSDLGESLPAYDEQASSIDDGHLGPKLNKGHEAPVNDGA